jgi:hypothetical protein
MNRNAARIIMCAACGRPPRNAQPLLRCTRCKYVYYHDRQCQRAHYPLHRSVCSHNAGPTSTPAPTQRQGEADPGSATTRIRHVRPLRRLEVVDMEGKGKGVRAGEQITKDEEIAVLEPLVPPVLIREGRTTHCALCFHPVAHDDIITVSTNPKYHTIICRHGCGSSVSQNNQPKDGRGGGDVVAVPEWLKDEVKAVERLLATFYAEPDSPVIILPTAILIFRIMTTARGVGAVDEMQNHDVDHPSTQAQDDRWVHRQLVATLVQQLFLMANPAAKVPIFERIDRIHSAIKYNAFSIVDDDNGESLGIGLYQAPAYRFNHSCQPNAQQCFIGTTLHLYATRDIGVGEEICISYYDDDDDSNDNDERRRFLQREYRFVCQCPLCIGSR